MSPLLKALLIGAFAFSVLLVFAVRNINRRNATFQKELDAPKGHVSPALLETALFQAETQLQTACAGSNVRFEAADRGVLTIIRKRDRGGNAGYALRWEDRREDMVFLDGLRAAAEAQNLPAQELSRNKLEITFPDDYLRLETFVESTCDTLDHDDLRTVLTWVCKGLRTQEDAAI